MNNELIKEYEEKKRSMYETFPSKSFPNERIRDYWNYTQLNSFDNNKYYDLIHKDIEESYAKLTIEDLKYLIEHTYRQHRYKLQQRLKELKEAELKNKYPKGEEEN